jgi:transcriptional regulator with XRE-family HTH domain
MEPERLAHLIESCFQRRRRAKLPYSYANVARFLGVTPMTLRRWLRGDAPIPRSVEIVMEIMHENPEVRAAWGR